MKEILEIILEDPRAFIIDSICCMFAFVGWVALYIILSCFVP